MVTQIRPWKFRLFVAGILLTAVRAQADDAEGVVRIEKKSQADGVVRVSDRRPGTIVRGQSPEGSPVDPGIAPPPSSNGPQTPNQFGPGPGPGGPGQFNPGPGGPGEFNPGSFPAGPEGGPYPGGPSGPIYGGGGPEYYGPPGGEYPMYGGDGPIPFGHADGYGPGYGGEPYYGEGYCPPGGQCPPGPVCAHCPEFLGSGPLANWMRMNATAYRSRNQVASQMLKYSIYTDLVDKGRWLRCKFGYFVPTGGCGTGVPLAGKYGMVYPVDPNYFDQRDGQVYAAQGYNGPVSVPLAPVVNHTYNYGWGVPSSRLTPILHDPGQVGAYGPMAPVAR